MTDPTTTPAMLSDVTTAVSTAVAGLQPQITALENHLSPPEPGGNPGNPSVGLQLITAAAGRGYGDLVRRVSRGSAPSIETVGATLYLAGKTLLDLENDARAYAIANGGKL
jgi:hypothetical protein